MNITLERVRSEQRETLFRLLQYSLFEESMTDGNEMTDEALFDYPWFDAYFTEPEREAYLIRECGAERLLGFAMIRRHDDGRRSIAEFLVIPKYRRQGVGMQAAKACFALHDGLWEVKPSYGSKSAKAFWRNVIGQICSHADWQADKWVFTAAGRER